jgi:hypothetical protein
MTIGVHTLSDVDGSSFGLGGLSSHDADVAAAYGQEAHSGVGACRKRRKA